MEKQTIWLDAVYEGVPREGVGNQVATAVIVLFVVYYCEFLSSLVTVC
jgi:hypothetical protein